MPISLSLFFPANRLLSTGPGIKLSDPEFSLPRRPTPNWGLKSYAIAKERCLVGMMPHSEPGDLVDHPGRHWACTNCCDTPIPHLSLSCVWVAQCSPPCNGMSSLHFTSQSATAPEAALETPRGLSPRIEAVRKPEPRARRPGQLARSGCPLQGATPSRLLLCCRAPAPARPGPRAPRLQLTEEGQRPAAPRAVIRAAGSRHGVLAALVRSLPCSLVAGEPAPRSRATPLSWDAESRSDTESTEANFHFPLAELRWPALGTAF